jgi:hypothetical protein
MSPRLLIIDYDKGAGTSLKQETRLSTFSRRMMYSNA